MSQLNIHWRGYPNHRLPRIRLASPHNRGPSGRGYAQFTALEGSLIPYSLPLEKARLQQRLRIREKNNVSLRPLGSNVASRRPSLGPVSKCRCTGVESPQGELEAPTFTGRPSSLPLRLSDDVVGFAEPHSIPSLVKDGRGSPAISKYAVATSEPVDPKLPVQSKKWRNNYIQNLGRWQDRNFSTKVVYQNSIQRRASRLRSSYTQDLRLPVRTSSRRSKSRYSRRGALSQPRDNEEMMKPLEMKKQSISATPSAEPGTRGQICSTSTQSTAPTVQLSHLPSRTPSRLIALKKFSRGLERHLIAQEAIRKAGMSHSSISSSTNSADTIRELLPYIAEFQAAGLAVTSDQQRRPAVRDSERETVRLITKEVGDKEQTRIREPGQVGKVTQNITHDSSSIGPSEESASSNGTIIVSSDCGKSNGIVECPARNKSIQNASLPWFRKTQEQSPPESLSPSCLGTSNNTNLSSGYTCVACATTIFPFSPGPLKSNGKKIEFNTPRSCLRSTDTGNINKYVHSVRGEIESVVQPMIPERPSRLSAGLRTECNKFTKDSGNNAFGPLEAVSHSDQGISRKVEEGEAKLHNEPARRSSRRKSPSRINSASDTSVRLFRASEKLLSLQKAPQVEVRGSDGVSKVVTSTVESKILAPFGVPPDTSPPRPPATDGALEPKSARQSPDTSIQDQYGFETPSIFELALHDVVTGSQSLQDQFLNEERAIISHPASYLARGKNCDPVKRRSVPYTAPTLPPHVLNRTTESSLGFTTSEYGVSRYLADHRALEGLGVNTLVDRAKQTVRKRKVERDQRIRGHECDSVQDHDTVLVDQKPKDGNKKRQQLRVDETERREFLVAQMLGRREARACETVKERALAMGWRGRNVSAGF